MSDDRATAEQLPILFDPASTEPLTHQQTVLMSLDAIYEHANQDTLRILREDKRVERKPASILKAHELADYFSMWANTPAIT